MSQEPTVNIFDPHVPLVQPAESQSAEVDVPDAIVDLLESDVLAHASDRDVYPLAVPANAAIGADVAHLEAIGVDKRRELAGKLAGRALVERRRWLLLKCFMRPLMIELLAEVIELALLTTERVGRRTGGFGLECAVHTLVPAVLLRSAGLDELR